MIIVPHSNTGNAQAAADYLLGMEDSKGNHRDVAPQILRGDVAAVVSVAEKSGFKHNHTSATFSFSENLTMEECFDFIDEAEKIMFPVDKDRVERSWILHSDKKHPDTGEPMTELMCIAANVDLENGNNMVWFGGDGKFGNNDWRTDFDPWRDQMNIKNGWSRPDEIKNLTTDLSLKNDFKYVPVKDRATSQKVSDSVTNYLLNNFDGISSRDELVEKMKTDLEPHGIKVENEKNKSISISHPDLKKNIRLKGSIYDKDNYDDRGFRLSVDRTDIKEYRNSAGEYKDKCAAADAAIDKRAERFSKRTHQPAPERLSVFDESVFRSLPEKGTDSKIEATNRTSESERDLEKSTGRTEESTQGRGRGDDKQSSLDVEGSRSGDKQASSQNNSAKGSPKIGNGGAPVTGSQAPDTSPTNLVSKGQENESAFDYGQRKEREFKFYKNKQEKELARFKQHLADMKKIGQQHEQFTKEWLSSISRPSESVRFFNESTKYINDRNFRTKVRKPTTGSTNDKVARSELDAAETLRTANSSISKLRERGEQREEIARSSNKSIEQEVARSLENSRRAVESAERSAAHQGLKSAVGQQIATSFADAIDFATGRIKSTAATIRDLGLEIGQFFEKLSDYDIKESIYNSCEFMRSSFEKTTNYRNGGLRDMPVQQAIIFAAMASQDDKLPFDVSMIHPSIRTQVFEARDTLEKQREASKTAESTMKLEFKPPWAT